MGDLTRAYNRIISTFDGYINATELIWQQQEKIVVLVNKQSSAIIACVDILRKDEHADLKRIFDQTDKWDIEIEGCEANIARLEREQLRMRKTIHDGYVEIRNVHIPNKVEKLKARHKPAVKAHKALQGKKSISEAEVDRQVKAAKNAWFGLADDDRDGMKDLEEVVKSKSNAEKKVQMLDSAMETIEGYVKLKLKKYDKLQSQIDSIMRDI